MSWFRLFYPSRAEIAEKLEDFLEFILRALRDQNGEEDYWESFSLQPAERLIRFHHQDMPPAERGEFVRLMNRILKGHWTRLGIRLASEKLSKLYTRDQPGCKFELRVGRINQWQFQRVFTKAELQRLQAAAETRISLLRDVIFSLEEPFVVQQQLNERRGRVVVLVCPKERGGFPNLRDHKLSVDQAREDIAPALVEFGVQECSLPEEQWVRVGWRFYKGVRFEYRILRGMR